jgi:hypothetical protein
VLSSQLDDFEHPPVQKLNTLGLNAAATLSFRQKIWNLAVPRIKMGSSPETEGEAIRG